MLYPDGDAHSKRNIANAEAWIATIVISNHEAMSNGSKKAVGDMIPKRFATIIAIPDSWNVIKKNVNAIFS